MQNSEAYLFKPRPATRFMTTFSFSRPASSGKFYRLTGATMATIRRKKKPDGEMVDEYLDAGKNPPDGVIVAYFLKQKPEDEVKLTFLDAGGKEIRTFSSEEKNGQPSSVQDTAAGASDEIPGAGKVIKSEKKDDEKKEPRVAKEVGANRFIWDLHYPDPTKVEGYVAAESALAGPIVPPGRYQVRLTVGDQTFSESFEVEKDPRVPATQADLEAQFELRLKIWEKLSETHDAINMLRNVRQQIEEWERRTEGQKDHEAVTRAGKSLKDKLLAVEDELVQWKAKNRQDTLHYPVKLNAKLATLSGTVASADAAPTRQEYELFDDLVARIDVQLKRLREILDTDVAAFNKLIRESDVPAIIPSRTHPTNQER
jgi:hypothetical protein